MKIVQKTCAGWDGNSHPAFIWKRINGKGYCKSCTLRLEPPKALVRRNENTIKQVRKSIKKVSDKQKEINKERSNQTKILHEAMRVWFAKQYKVCENCGVSVSNEFNPVYVHHLLPKSKYPEVELNTDYFMMLCMDCHNGFEVSPNEEKHKEIYNKTEKAKENYGRIN